MASGIFKRFSCSSQEEHVLKHIRRLRQQSKWSCSSQEEHVLKRGKQEILNIKTSCSSQEEHVLKPEAKSAFMEQRELLLARGACIETVLGMEEVAYRLRLLLARGACIETCLRRSPQWSQSCSSQEEHVLKLFGTSTGRLTLSSCSSQEEHVLKHLT